MRYSKSVMYNHLLFNSVYAHSSGYKNIYVVLLKDFIIDAYGICYTRMCKYKYSVSIIFFR